MHVTDDILIQAIFSMIILITFIFLTFLVFSEIKIYKHTYQLLDNIMEVLLKILFGFMFTLFIFNLFTIISYIVERI